jgi:hypothetical protein
VILSEDMVLALLLLSQYFPLFGHIKGMGKEACSYRSYYADQVRNGIFSASPPVVLNCSVVYTTQDWEVCREQRSPTGGQAPACLFVTLP